MRDYAQKGKSDVSTQEASEEGFQMVLRRRNKVKCTITNSNLTPSINAKQYFRPSLSKFVHVRNITKDGNVKASAGNEGNGGAPLSSSNNQ